MPNGTLVNFAAGETSPRSRGRFDLEWFRASCEKSLNFIPEVQGPSRFRPAFKFLRWTRAGQVARMFRFRNNDQSYMLEFTGLKMRVYKDEDLLTLERTTVTGVLLANPAGISVASATNLVNGDEVIITGIVGTEELNGRQVKLANAAGTSFELVDPVTGNSLDATDFTDYVSGGTVREVYEITTPYLEADLDDLHVATVNGVMYIAHRRYTPRKLTIDSAETFTLSTYSRTNDPFNAYAATMTLTGISRSTSTIITFTAGDVINPDVIYTFAGVVGTTEINAGTYRLVATTPSGGSPRGILKNASTGANVNSSAWTAYVSGGTATSDAECPISVAFYEGRLGFFGSNQRPDTFFLSRSPDSDGNDRYDDFTGGTDADHACFFTLAPVNGQIAQIAWGRGTADYLFLGTFGGVFRVSGSGVDEAITPSSVNSRQFDEFGTEAVMPAGGARLFFLQRGGVALRTIRYSADENRLFTYDMLLNAEHIADSRLQRVVVQTGRPDILWVVREDGTLAGMTVQQSENVAGWFRVKPGGTSAIVLDAQPLERTDKNDQLWIVAARTVNGTTRRSVEVMADDVVFPDFADFYSGASNEDDDHEAWLNALYRRQEEYIHVDSAGTYNGSDRGVTAAATLTLSAITVGTGRTATASAAVFVAGDVGRELWVKPDRDTGVGAGRATITAFTSSTEVTVEITAAFSSVGAHAAGDWYFTATNIFVPHLDGASSVAVVVDGAVYSDGRGLEGPTVAVADSKITLTDAAAVVHVGLPYDGFLKTHNLELANPGFGPAQTKPRNIASAFVRFLGTLGVDFGVDLYDLQEIEWRSDGDINDRPPPPFSGVREIVPKNGWANARREEQIGKHLIVAQRLPMPCVVQSIDIEYETGER